MNVLFSVSESLQYPRRKGKNIQLSTHTAEALPKSLAPPFLPQRSPSLHHPGLHHVAFPPQPWA